MSLKWHLRRPHPGQKTHIYTHTLIVRTCLLYVAFRHLPRSLKGATKGDEPIANERDEPSRGVSVPVPIPFPVPFHAHLCLFMSCANCKPKPCPTMCRIMGGVVYLNRGSTRNYAELQRTIPNCLRNVKRFSTLYGTQ